MRKTILTATFALLTVSAAFLACNKENISEENTNNKSYLRETDCNEFDFTEANIGQLHNNYVIELFQNLDVSNPENAKNEIFQKFATSTYDATWLGISHDEYNISVRTILDSLEKYKFDIRNSQDPAITQTSTFSYLVVIMNKIDSFENVSDLNTVLDSIKLVATANLSCSEKDVVVGTIEIAKSSAYLWSDVENGGMGFYESTFPEDPNSQAFQRTARQALTGAIVGDASASAAYFTTMGVGMAVGWVTPGANVALLGMWALCAGVGSATGAFGF